MLPQGARASFDRKTHRKTWQRTTRLTYIFYAGKLLQDRSREDITDDVLEHLENAHTAIRRSWGMTEWQRLAAAKPVELDERTQDGLKSIFGEDRYQLVQNQSLASLPADDGLKIIDELGRRALTEIYRPLLLSVITELWVEYLTQMEALRVAIGLEAYAQRDPLVQYKTRASELFQNLLRDMRIGVVTRMFTFRPRDLSSLPLAEIRSREADISPDQAEEPVALSSGQEEAVQAEPDQAAAGEPVGEAQSVPAGPSISQVPGEGAPDEKTSGGLSRSQRRRRGRR
jgi:preprotein translocase subunit SecA